MILEFGVQGAFHDKLADVASLLVLCFRSNFPASGPRAESGISIVEACISP